MVADVSRAILTLAEGETMAQIEKKWFGEPGACQSQSSTVGLSNLSFQSFGGLFLITGVVSSFTLLVYLSTFFYRERDQVRAAEAAGSGSASLRRLRAWLQHYDRKDLKSPTFKTWSDESLRNGSDVGNRTPRWIAESPRNGGGTNTMRTAGEEEQAIAWTSPFSVSVSSEMNAGSSPEEMPGSELGNSFVQRMAEEAASVEMARPTASQLQ